MVESTFEACQDFGVIGLGDFAPADGFEFGTGFIPGLHPPAHEFALVHTMIIGQPVEWRTTLQPNSTIVRSFRRRRAEAELDDELRFPFHQLVGETFLPAWRRTKTGG